ncbi:hypothetical protein QR680_012347 [Steinernema hermaphroditum]|uniref:Uncharacterized protein n=1 Tax=Steinernema hermaphroditum TaxID=289476 RepID=A0AA39I1T0_9BILA|nr:hypothetical protein QR680_012347 [Steinernema hermaphroditum]
MPPKKAKDQSAEYAYYPGKCKPIVDDLPPAEELRRIQDLATYVREMQEALPQNERGDFCNLFAHVTRTDLLKRSAQKAENAVSLGCCIADLLRVFAPHPPTLEERRMLEVLLFMVSGLKALDLSGHIFDQALYLLENIATLESLKLGLQLPGFQDILRKMIITSLNVFNARDDVVLGKPPNVDIDAKHVQRLLLGLVQSLIASADHISNEVLDALFFFIIEPQKSQSRVSYRMAAEIIKQSCTTIEPWCVPFLSQAILTQEMPECKMTGAKRLDSIVYSLYEIVPETILTILPQMEGALTAANPEHRLNATKLLGDIFKLRDVNAADRVPQLWSVYIERSKDVNMEVRKQCIEQLPSIYLEHQSVRGEISTALGRRSDDDIEEVRLVAVRSIFEILRNRMDLATDVMLRQVRNHVHPREKKQSVRHECLMELSKIYSSMHTSGKSTASELATIADTMGGVFRFVSISMKEDRIALEKAFVLNIVSFKAPVETRVSMLLDLFVNIQDETPLKVLTTLLTMQGRRLRVIRSMWEAVRAANERNESMSADEKDAETYKKETEAMIHQLADTELEPHVIVNGLHKFAAYIEKEPRVFNALKEMLKGDYQCEQVEKHMLDIRRLLGAPETGMDEAERRQVRSFLERSVPLQVDNKIAVELSQRVQRLIRKTSCGNNEALAKMKPYLAAWKMIAEFFPQCFLHDEVALVTSDLLENDSSIVMEHALSIIISASRVRNCQQYLLKVFPDYVIERIEFIAKRGPPKAAKYAARCLCRILGRDRTSAVFSGMIEELVSHVDAKDGLCETALQTLAIILHAFPKEHAVQMRAMISEKLFNFVIRADTFSEERSPKREDESEAIPVKKPKEIRPQIMAFKFLYRYHRSLQTHKDSTVKKSIALWVQTINKKAANLSEQISEDNAYILMFYAANYLLKMSQYPVYKTLIATPEVLCCLSPIVYGFPPALRTLFLHRFQPLMNKNLLPVEFMALYMLAPLVKNDHEYVQAMTSSLHASLLNRWRLQSKSKSYGPEKASEYAVAFTISAFAFLSEWENPEDINLLKKYKKCLWMLLGAMNERRDSCCNLVLVRTILETLKMSESAWFPEEFSEEQRSDTNKKIWILADTALSLLYNRAKMTAAGNYRDINLSAQFFTYASSLKKTARKSFAPKEILDDDTESVTSTSTATRAHRDAEHASRSVSPAVNGTKGTRSKWLGHLVSDDAEESDTSKDISKQNGSLRRSRRGKNASMADSEPGPSTSKPAAIRQVKQEKDDSVGRAQRRTPVSPELLETPVIKRTRRPKVDRKELEAPAPAKPTRGRGRRRQKEEDASEEEEKPEEMAEKPKRGSRRGVATRKKEKSESPAEEADSDKAEEDEEIKSPTEDEEAQVRSSGRVRKKREIFDCSPIVSPTKQKPMTKMRRVDLESRFAAISPIVGTLASTSGPVSSTPNIPARRGRPKSKPKSVELPSRPSRNKK